MHPGLNLSNLKYFYDAVESQSISEAARKNFVTQSAVSQAIQKLEKAFGVSLITHQRNCFKVTPEGESIFVHTRQLFQTLKTMSTISQESLKVVSGQINIACTQSIAMNLIADALQVAKKTYPQVSVNMKIAKMENIPLLLMRGLMDMAIVVESEICDQFDKQVVRKGFFHLYAKKGLKGSLDDGIYVDHKSGLFVDRLLKTYHKRTNKELQIMQELDSWQVLYRSACSGIGHAFLPDFIVGQDNSLKIQDVIPPIPYRIVAIYPKGVHLSRASKAFLELL
jgi:DNA-binding transcriptional LysR family regulator